ncbi:MAG: oxidoreductase, partial [Candidatus Aminicenantales bacterium]
ISVVDENTAWASGSQGTVLRTLDGGKSWQAAGVPGMSRTDFRDVEAFDAGTAVVMGIGRPAKIFRTGDGGANWTEVYSCDTPGIFLDALAFAGKRAGWAVGDPVDGRFVLLRTEDGGKSWQDLPFARRPAAQGGEGCFAASGTCLVAQSLNGALFCTGGPAARLIRTSDGGATWTAVRLPLSGGQPSSGAFGITLQDGKNGLAVGGDYRHETAAQGNAATTSDGGASWAAVEMRPPSGFRECAAFVPGSAPSAAVTVGPSGSDYSLDGGRTWAPIPGPAGWHSLGVAPDGRCAWAVGKGGLIAVLRF